MSEALDGKVAVITGASRGIGAAIARRFAAEGALVGAVARTAAPGGSHLPGSLEETVGSIEAAGGRAVAVAADLAEPESYLSIVPAVEASLGPIDILVNNAAACFYLPLEQTSEKRLRIAFEVNVIAPYLLTRAVVEGLRSRGSRGWILDVTSAIVDLPKGPPYRVGAPARFQSTYASSKAALNRLTQALAIELYDDGIAVNALAPRAGVLTEGADALVDLPDDALEPVEAMAEAALLLCTCDPAVDTGLVVKSLELLAARRRPVRALDGGEYVPA